MRRLPYLLALLAALGIGCADRQLAATYTNQHIRQADREARALHDRLPAGPEREKAAGVVFHTSSASGWQSATLRLHGGAKLGVEIPTGPTDRQAIVNEDAALARFNQEVDRELAARQAVGGWMGKLAGGAAGGGGILSVVVGLMVRRMRRQGRALGKYRKVAHEGIPEKRLTKLVNGDPDLAREEAAARKRG